MTPCETWLPDLVDDVAGELAPERRAALSAHLVACRACHAERDALAGTERLLAATSSPPDPLELSGFVHRAADRAERFRDGGLRGLWWSLTRGQRLTTGFSAAALAASLVFFLAPRPSVVEPVARIDEAPALEEFAASEQDDISLDDAFGGLSADEIDELADLLGSPG